MTQLCNIGCGHCICECHWIIHSTDSFKHTGSFKKQKTDCEWVIESFTQLDQFKTTDSFRKFSVSIISIPNMNYSFHCFSIKTCTRQTFLTVAPCLKELCIICKLLMLFLCFAVSQDRDPCVLCVTFLQFLSGVLTQEHVLYINIYHIVSFSVHILALKSSWS